ncbi:hypothetical protein PR202_gb05075 [Eleusine coracana subsp. coracana]|uniref:Uncharacterized protein n=1 Tax=Eleusine coracana subsp. coracana TaxID=191504 RepID=A0AAV5E4H6_ELECO|nr:hypothetical protein PR202_gb05075 [Eleusine coracana subsp. coracana]
MPKGAKKRAKLKKKQQQRHDGGNNAHQNSNGSGSDNNTASVRHDADQHHTLRIPPKASHVDASEDSMESSEEMVTPRAAGSEPDEEERKAAADVPVEHAVQAEEVMVDALPPETSGQDKYDAEVEVHAVVQEPEVQDVVVDEAPALQEPEVAEAPVVEVSEVKREVAKVHPVHDPEPKVDEAVVVAETSLPPPVVHEPEVKGGNVVVKDSSEVSRSREVDVHTTEARGPAVAVAASAHRATWWNCCGLFDAFSGSER